MGIEFCQTVNNKDLSPRIVSFLPINEENFIVKLESFINKDSDHSEEPHNASNHKKGNIKNICSRIGDENVNILSCFTEEEPIPWNSNKEVEHPKRPEIHKIVEEIQNWLSIEISNVCSDKWLD